MPHIIYGASSLIENDSACLMISKATDAGPFRHNFHYYYLYNITCLVVKENPLIISNDNR
jgi:hypothetical protein